MVALGDCTMSGGTLFAKNSDRPVHEAQPLELHARAHHDPGADAGCQFVRVPQAKTTWRHVGSRLHWDHGYEQGFNEHQVAIGNEYLPTTMKAASEPKLVGGELIRLGLERGTTAREAVEVMTAHITEYGQGKFANDAGVRQGDNAYMVVDPREAFVIEAAGHDWAVKEVSQTASISNIGSVRDDWASTSKAVSGEAFEWAAAFTDGADNPNAVRRQCRTDALLRSRRGGIDARTMISVLSDHWLDDDVDSDFNPIPGEIRSVCMHPIGDNQQSTTASLVADLCDDGSRLPVFWCGLYSPCMALHLPVFLEGELPAQLAIGRAERTDDSPWWMFHDLTASGLAGGHDRVAQIRDGWSPLQEELLQTAYELADQAARLIRERRNDEASRLVTEYMAHSVSRMLVKAGELLTRP
jgi:secernin